MLCISTSERVHNKPVKIQLHKVIESRWHIGILSGSGAGAQILNPGKGDLFIYADPSITSVPDCTLANILTAQSWPHF